MRDVKNIRFKLGVLAVAALALTACGTGTESGGADGDGRNTALAGDNGTPFQGYSPNIGRIAIDAQNGAPWVSTSNITGVQESASAGVVTGGAVKLAKADSWTIEPSFPRIQGTVSATAIDPRTRDAYVGGILTGAGTVTGLGHLAVISERGVVRNDFNARFNGGVSTLVARNGLIHVGGSFSGVFTNDATSGARNRTGYAAIKASDRSLLPPVTLEGFAPGEAAVWSMAFAGDDSNRALVVVRSGSPFTWSLRSYDLGSGRRINGIEPILVDRSGIELVDFGNGIAAYRGISQPNTITFYDFSVNRTLGTHVAPDGNFYSSMIRADNVLRIISVVPGGTRFIDINPTTRAISKFYNAQPVDPGRTRGRVIWGNATETLTADGQLHSITATLGPLALVSSAIVAPNSAGTILAASRLDNQFIIGGTFTTVADVTFGVSARLKAGGLVSSTAESFSSRYAEVMTTTPYGAVVRDENRLSLHRNGPGAPGDVIATARPSATAMCRYVYNDVDFVANRLYVTGCWDAVEVDGNVRLERTVEITLGNDKPRLTGWYETAIGLQVASIDDKVMVASRGGATDAISYFLRGGLNNGGGGRLLWRQTYSGDVHDITGFPSGIQGIHRFLIGGWSLNFDGTQSGALAVVDASVLAPTFRTLDWMTLPAHALRYDRPNNRVFIAGESNFGGTARSLLALRTPNLDATVGPDVIADRVILDIDVAGPSVWLGGLFQNVTVDGSKYRSSGIAGFSDWSARQVITQPEVPLVNQPAAPADQSAPSTPADDPNVSLEPVPNPTEELPLLPANGTPPAGEFRVVDDAGNASTAVVDRTGVVTLPPPVDPATLTITRLAPGSRTVRVSWSPLADTNTYTVRAQSGRTVKTCRTTKTSCTVKKLDPWRTWTFTVEAKNGSIVTSSFVSPALKPFVSVKKGKSTNLRDIVKPGAKGKATWRVNGACKVAGTKLTTPKRATRCTLTVKAGTSTRTVSVRVG